MPGYGVKVVEPLKSTLTCPECKLLFRDAVQTESGIVLCESCFKQILQYPNCTSPRSSITIEKECYPDKAVRREISQLLVLCSHITYGCPWQGQLQHLEGHCQDCKYKPVSCTNPGCSELLPAEKLDSHVNVNCSFRNITCDYCKEETAANQLKDHLNQCPNVPMECGRCPEWVARDLLEEHQLRECPYVECPVPGCGEILLRRGTEKEPNTIASHLTDPHILFQHMLALFTYFGSSFDHLQTRFSHLESTSQQHSTHLEQLTKDYTEVQHKIKGLLEKQKEKGMDQTLATKLSHLEERQTQVEQTIQTLHSQHTANGMIVHEGSLMGSSHEIRVMDIEKRIEELYEQQTTLKTQISELEMQLQSLLASAHTLQGHLRTQVFNDGARELHPISNGDFNQLVQRGQIHRYPTEASTSCSLYEVEYFQPTFGAAPFMQHHLYNTSREVEKQPNVQVLQDGTFLWRIPQVSQCRQNIAALRSPPFITAQTGYKMCIEAYLNGKGTGYNTHLSLSFMLMKGEYDSLLKWPFDYKVTLVLVDQTHLRHIWHRFQPDHDNPCFQCPQLDSNVPYNIPQFAELSVLDDGHYVREDVMYIKCIVDTTNIFHP